MITIIDPQKLVSSLFKYCWNLCTVINDMMAVFLGFASSFTVVTKDK
ncbi:hypothetical protein QUF81_12495 [Peribacillus simplex]|uniref:Uncharacterized protein n=1 Tax=Peribacillus simplex TaxID=1478 RepID=A0AAW7IA57_9BACI|nr:hypothetical protein [Peribacillus simplex]MDM5293998.1 hypothetical protein [Peribacillus simplex]MDM5452943.1 hypothetical protein [Peribacillus simplex]